MAEKCYADDSPKQTTTCGSISHEWASGQEYQSRSQLRGQLFGSQASPTSRRSMQL